MCSLCGESDQSTNQNFINLFEPNLYRDGYAGASSRMKQGLVIHTPDAPEVQK
jgi:hypothetical protein